MAAYELRRRISRELVVFAPPKPLGVAIQNKFRTGLGEFNKPLKMIH